MNIKKPIIEVFYNKKNVTNLLNKYVLSLTYTDYLKGESDELSLKLINPDNLFNGDWYPKKGDKIQAKIGYSGQKMLNCGTFTIDEPQFEFTSQGDFVTIKSLATSINSQVRERNSQPFKGKTLVQIANQIGKKHGFSVRGSEGNILLSRVSQYNETDLEFLDRISNEFGYVFKLNDDILTFTRLESLEKAKVLGTLTPDAIRSLHLSDTSTKTYTACRVQYYSPKTGKLTSYTAKGGKKDVKGETMKMTTVCHSKEEAMAKANAGLKSGQATLSGSVELKEGNPYFIAGSCHTISGRKKLNGKYKVTQASHEVSITDWTVSGEIERVA